MIPSDIRHEMWKSNYDPEKPILSGIRYVLSCLFVMVMVSMIPDVSTIPEDSSLYFIRWCIEEGFSILLMPLLFIVFLIAALVYEVLGWVLRFFEFLIGKVFDLFLSTHGLILLLMFIL